MTCDGESLLIWGDIVHFAEFQLARPEIGVRFDVNPAQAIATRRALLATCAREDTRIAGMHLPFPGVGRIVAEGSGYRFAAEA